jgi:hypothetical protein
MDFDLTEEQRAFRDLAAGFAAEHMLYGDGLLCPL